MTNSLRTGKSPCYQWVHPLFRLGHVQVRKLLNYQRVQPLMSTQQKTSQLGYVNHIIRHEFTIHH